MSQKASLAIIVPCYNEEDSIPEFEKELLLFLSSAAVQKLERMAVFVINNNSTDRSLSLLQKMQGMDLPINCQFQVLNEPVQGYGAALKCGFAQAKEDYICFLDLDNTYPVIMIHRLLEFLLEGGFDFVYGARLHSKSDISFVRWFGNFTFMIAVRVLYGGSLTDVCSGMRVFKREFVESILKIETQDLSFSIDFTIRIIKNKYRIGELPIEYKNRTGYSKLSVFKDGWKFLKVILSNLW